VTNGPFQISFALDQIFSNTTEQTRQWSYSKKSDKGFYSLKLFGKEISRAIMISVKSSHA